MVKKWTALALVLIFVLPCALSEEFPGRTVFLKTHTVYADFEGTVDQVSIRVGESVLAGENVLTVRTERVYADTDATVRGLKAEENSLLPEKAFVLEPKEKYRLSGSVKYTYYDNKGDVVHTGDTVYIACVKDSSHWAVGYIAKVDDEEFTVYTTHGTLYVGEAVNVFRSPDRLYMNRIGRATVYAADNIDVQKEGVAVRLYVREDDRVEKGEALMDYLPGKDAPEQPEIYAETSGIVTEIFVQPGDKISKGDKLYEYALEEEIVVRLEISQADMPNIVLGAQAEVTILIDPEETPHPARVTAIAPVSDAEDAIYEVILMMDAPPEGLLEGLSVRVNQWKQPE